jgi:hypothetical protein
MVYVWEVACRVFTELDPTSVLVFVEGLCANTGDCIRVIAAAIIITVIADRVIVSFVVCCFIIYIQRKQFVEYYCY